MQPVWPVLTEQSLAAALVQLQQWHRLLGTGLRWGQPLHRVPGTSWDCSQVWRVAATELITEEPTCATQGADSAQRMHNLNINPKGGCVADVAACW